MSRAHTRFACAVLVMSAAWVGIGANLHAQARDYPIIDMHLHTQRASAQGPPGSAICMPPAVFLAWDSKTALNPRNLVRCPNPFVGARTDEELMRRTLAIMERENIIGVGSGSERDVWRSASPNRIIPGLLTSFERFSPDTIRSLLASGAVKVLAEVTTQYRGLPPSAPEFDAYWAIAESLDVPVGIHMGSGPPGIPLMGQRRYRAAHGNPLHLEDVLTRHPRLRVYISHAGYPYIDDLISLLLLYPQVHVDIGVIGWTIPRPEFHRFLQRLIDSGFGERIMFGSDQMVWPEAIEATIEAIERASFLTPQAKRAIYYENARRFLRLER